MPVEELSGFPGFGRDQGTRGSTPLPDLSADFLGSDAHREDHEPFDQGYLAGWQSVRGADDEPLLIPPCPVFVGPAMYMVGFSVARRGSAMLHDGYGGPVGGKPGFVVSDASQATRDQAYRQMCDELRNAWRQPAGNAAPGATVTRSDTAPRHPISAADAQAIRDAAYREMCDELTNAWR